MRGTPVGKHPISLPVVGLTRSVESTTARWPQDGFVCSYCAFPHGVISGIIPVNEYPAYLRALGGICPSQTPEKSGTPSAVLGSACGAALSAGPFVFEEVCARNPDERIIAATSASVWPTLYFFISGNPPVVRIESKRRAARSVPTPGMSGDAASRFAGNFEHYCCPGSGGGPKGITSPLAQEILRRFKTFKPFLAGRPTTVIWSPGFSLCPFQP